MVEADQEEPPLKVDPKYLIKSEQKKVEDFNKHKKFGNLWKSHQEAMRLKALEEKSNRDLMKQRIAELVEKMEYDDDYDESMDAPVMNKLGSVAAETNNQDDAKNQADDKGADESGHSKYAESRSLRA